MARFNNGLPPFVNREGVRLTPAQANEYPMPKQPVAQGNDDLAQIMQAYMDFKKKQQQEEKTPLAMNNLVKYLGLGSYQKPQLETVPQYTQKANELLNSYGMTPEQYSDLLNRSESQARMNRGIDAIFKQKDGIYSKHLTDLDKFNALNNFLKEGYATTGAIDTQRKNQAQLEAMQNAMDISLPDMKSVEDILGKVMSAKSQMDLAKQYGENYQTLAGINNQAKADLLEQKQDLESPDKALDREYKQVQIDKILAGLQNPKKDKGRGLTAGSAERLADTKQSVLMSDELGQKILQLPPRLTTPAIGQLATLNPFDTQGQIFRQYIDSVKQVIGKGLEGGVLRKEDEVKYERIIPKAGDTRAVLIKKNQQLNELLRQKYNTSLESLGKAGYDVSQYQALNNKPNKYSGLTREQKIKILKQRGML